ncbi:hypothetical protein C8R44DRAFT_742473 [Mycena epipterygia]|nr:hypothetical protein C8R44DRAFT_742473 [Mycena epipterygia]
MSARSERAEECDASVSGFVVLRRERAGRTRADRMGGEATGGSTEVEGTRAAQGREHERRYERRRWGASRRMKGRHIHVPSPRPLVPHFAPSIFQVSPAPISGSQRAPSPIRSPRHRVGEGSADIDVRASTAHVGGSAACHVSGLSADHDVGGNEHACAMRTSGERASMWGHRSGAKSESGRLDYTEAD